MARLVVGRKIEHGVVYAADDEEEKEYEWACMSWQRSRGFPSLKIGSRIVIPKDKLIEWIDEQCAVSE